MRVAVVDIGTNSTRLLIADAGDGALEELDRRSIVTRLGEGVDATGRLGDEPQRRVFGVLDDYARAIESHGAERRLAVMTSAVRDAANGADFAAAVHDTYGLDGRTLSGDEEARLTFLGATAGRAERWPRGPGSVAGVRPGGETRGAGGPLLVIDIGGGSTELVVGEGGTVSFHVSVQAGVVRHTERHLEHDPPHAEEMDALARDVRALYEDAVPAGVREPVAAAVAVAGTATSCAAIDGEVEPYDPARVEGYTVSAERLAQLRDRLGALPLDERRQVPGLHPDRAPTIVAGTILLAEVLGVFGLGAFEASERDILWGVALSYAP
jgi:exopolyphosphatase/guanosine-5'-triphosphate,3'-diphosphate pyrophosphatase